MKLLNLEHLPDSENIKPFYKHCEYSKNFHPHVF